MTNYGPCILCDKRAVPPNCVLSHGRVYHIGCALDELERLQAHEATVVVEVHQGVKSKPPSVRVEVRDYDEDSEQQESRRRTGG